MTFNKVRQPKLADVILKQLEAMILEGSLTPGQKLPPERELAAQFAVSRPSLREAIQKLEAKGLVTRRQGGGTFVSENLQSAISDPLFELILSKPESQLDLLEFRHALEGIAAYYAALRGTPADFERIKLSFESIISCNDNMVGDQIDAIFEFFKAIAEASHNLVISHLVNAMAPLLKQNIETNFQMLKSKPDTARQVNDDRESLMNAIISGNPIQARNASHHHLAFIEETLLQMGSELDRNQRALRRLQQSTKQ
ncbi:pyruvate dehydrogenase complex transcriptional repressor PdhR [Catenovulum sp. SM1970]|uniref:pyruvate dehydrogenase complex transcriptional repressor PdhR n=1 Tax=Marinifaba aquimaris TaxID=2741323 RepID=UPI0015721621|nr:pyruvate dehydrogenase complex transcriptional repressor PdhR [Marinifaba aquimaris]NTS76566.1 pyruvate dehydrogenase complex transcriptional repressor PdhR [Marinifaba aquimaris]